jgi:valyl-tRNA synthetase
VGGDADIRDIFTRCRLFFLSLAGAEQVFIQSDKAGIPEEAVSLMVAGATIYIPLAELVDIAKEIERLENEAKRLESELSRVNGLLGNDRFRQAAPPEKIMAEEEKREKYQQMSEQVKIRLQQLNNLGTI